jgi:hypothetical protein
LAHFFEAYASKAFQQAEKLPCESETVRANEFALTVSFHSAMSQKSNKVYSIMRNTFCFQ